MTVMHSSVIFMPGGPAEESVVEAKKETISQFCPHSCSSTTWDFISEEELGPLSS